jgi:hypothetical protein
MSKRVSAHHIGQHSTHQPSEREGRGNANKDANNARLMLGVPRVEANSSPRILPRAIMSGSEILRAPESRQPMSASAPRKPTKSKTSTQENPANKLLACRQAQPALHATCGAANVTGRQLASEAEQ